ncbi:MAG: hypothetical protein AAF298_10305 [Cyanobacteria bacterium P01_A01_bin.40]
MDTLLPDFSQATFESGQVIDNQYFPLIPGTVLSYQGQLYDTEEIVAGFAGEEFDDDEIEEEEDLDELADDIESELDDVVEEIVNDMIDRFGDDIGEFDREELAEEITEELKEDVLEELTGEEIELGDDEAPDDFGDRFFTISNRDNTITGGAGADQFWLATAEIPDSANTIVDFSAAEDVIGIGGLGITLAELTLTPQDSNTLVALGVDATSLDESNFVII